MERIFLCVLRMSLAAGVVILGALLLRLMLRPAPKKYSYFLWVAAAYRLCAPAGLVAPFSLFRLLRRPVTAVAVRAPFELRSGLEAVIPDPAGVAHPAAQTTPAAVSAAAASFPWLRLLAWVWLAGVAAMALYSLLSGLYLRRGLRTAIRQEEGVWRASVISAPFLLGFPRPRIYLPWGLEGADLENVLAHERAHIRRGDPWWRFLGWTLLCLHWFNPLCWLAFFLMGRDMELSCDEAVLAHREAQREDYARSLLHIAVRVGPHSPAPLAFGEIGVRQRVANALRWRGRRGWARVLPTALCLLFILAAVTDAQALALPPRTLAVNADGSLGALRWGMTLEEALAACPELSIESGTSDGSDNTVYARLEGVCVLGYTADVTLTFPRYVLLSGRVSTERSSTPVLDQIQVIIPGSVDMIEELEAVLGPRERRQRDLSGQQAVVWEEGRPLPPYEERELPEELWYWHSGETGADLMDMALMRQTIPAWWEMTDEQLLESCCYIYGWDARIWVLGGSMGTDTTFVSRGEGYAYARALSQQQNQAG